MDDKKYKKILRNLKKKSKVTIDDVIEEYDRYRIPDEVEIDFELILSHLVKYKVDPEKEAVKAVTKKYDALFRKTSSLSREDSNLDDNDWTKSCDITVDNNICLLDRLDVIFKKN